MENKIELKKGLILKNIKNNNSLFDGLSYEGLCIIRDFEIPIFVYNLLPNESANIEITYYSKKCCFAKVIKLLNVSKERRILNEYEKLLYESGSAPLLSLDYSKQIEFKETLIKKLFARNLNIKEINPIIKSPKEFFYRNKITLQIEYKENEILFGFFKKYSHSLIPQINLLLANKQINNFYKNILLNPQTEIDIKIKETIFSLGPNKITLRSSNLDNNIEIVLNINKKIEKRLIDELIELNKLKKNYKISIFDELKNKWINLLEHQGIKYQIDNIFFEVKNDSFYQINEELAKLIYKQILDWIPNKNLNIVDAFSGVGTIACFIANKTKKVYSIEINNNATTQAKRNIEINKISNIEIINADANEWISKNKEAIDLVIFDPPREGLKNKSIEAIIQSQIKQIIYLSCDPKTLIRDLKEFTYSGYSIKKIQSYDMFPQTPHIETLVLIERKNET
ncbi:Hypothetical protein, putative RNA methyltransferase [Metamycoplasma auris 15026]|uniref:RNA methyltransferase n=1 Tax=Metamycoplasma auris 15026 TaxID=1188233 RepID=N9VD85_9BACT|nr:23S rRNA (uracil(1939)-C(5))-methyltransferase RlmD [Metamycoplasma auris]ENY69381.1 Hypothetical protein, putative RNA methyltransferase [Metamycoplasma auris 15026]